MSFRLILFSLCTVLLIVNHVIREVGGSSKMVFKQPRNPFDGAPILKLEDICSHNQTCYSTPENCGLDDCEFILSFRDGFTEFLVRDTDFSKYLAIFSVRAGVRAEKYLLCFPGSNKCFMGMEKSASFRIESKIPVKLAEIDEDNGDFIYSIRQGFFETGEDVIYYIKKGTISNRMSSKHGTPLFFLSGPQPAEAVQNASNRSDVKSLNDLFANYEKQIEDDYNQRKEVADRLMANITNTTYVHKRTPLNEINYSFPIINTNDTVNDI